DEERRPDERRNLYQSAGACTEAERHEGAAEDVGQDDEVSEHCSRPEDVVLDHHSHELVAMHRERDAFREETDAEIDPHQVHAPEPVVEEPIPDFPNGHVSPPSADYVSTQTRGHHSPGSSVSQDHPAAATRKNGPLASVTWRPASCATRQSRFPGG